MIGWVVILSGAVAIAVVAGWVVRHAWPVDEDRQSIERFAAQRRTLGGR